MEEQSRNDFLVETNGHCFLCLSQIESKHFKENRKAKVASNTFSAKHYSLQCLSSYLELDMRKVFVEDGTVPENLLELVEKSNLKVELCEECLSANDRFFELYRKLEKIKMEVASLLKGVLSKLENSMDAGRTGNFQKDIEMDESFGLGKVQVLEALRKEALQKCSRKINSVRPKVSVQNMSTRKLSKERQKLKTSILNNVIFDSVVDASPPRSVAQAGSDYDVEVEDNDGSFNSPESESEPNPVSADPLTGFPRRKTLQLQADVELKNVEKVFDKFEPRRKPKPDCLKGIPPPIKLVGQDGTSKEGELWMDPSTGKYKCQLCPREYNSELGFKTHFKVAHLKERYKCVPCGKEFSLNQTYRNHYKSAHVGVRYKCKECDSVFTRTSSLRMHQKSAHWGARFKCDYCPKTFTQSGIRNMHMKRQCQYKKSTNT